MATSNIEQWLKWQPRTMRQDTTYSDEENVNKSQVSTNKRRGMFN